MQPFFPFTNYAIEATCQFYDSDRIYDHMKIFAGNNSSAHIIMKRYNLMFEMYETMEAEINQVINTNNYNAQVFLFEKLKRTVTNPLISAVLVSEIEFRINQHNENAYTAFEAQITKKVSDRPAGFHYPDTPQSQLTKYYFYCIEEKPDYIDAAYISDYVDLLDKLLIKLRDILSRYIKLYDENKIKAHDIISSPQPLVAESVPAVQSEKKVNKLKVNMTVEQLIMLFRLLKELKLIESKFDKEIHAFIAENFETTNRPGYKFSVENIKKLWSSKEPDVLTYWIARFAELTKKAERK